MHAIAGIDDGNVEVLRHQVGRSRQGMADHDHIRAHRPQGVAGIEQRLALFDARAARLHQRSHGAHRLGGNFK